MDAGKGICRTEEARARAPRPARAWRVQGGARLEPGERGEAAQRDTMGPEAVCADCRALRTPE